MCLHSNVLHFSCTAIFSARTKSPPEHGGLEDFELQQQNATHVPTKNPIELEIGFEILDYLFGMVVG